MTSKKVPRSTAATIPVNLPDPLFVGIGEAARRLGFKVWTVRTFVWAKLLKRVGHRRKFLFSPADLVALSEKLRDGSVSFPTNPKTQRRLKVA